MGIFNEIASKVKSDLTWKAGQGVSSGISSGLSKVVKGKGAAPLKKCPKCKKKLTETGLKFCPSCGFKLVATCTKCTVDFPFGTKFCPQCGNSNLE